MMAMFQVKIKCPEVFDSTAIDSTQKFANRLQSGLFPPQLDGVV